MLFNPAHTVLDQLASARKSSVETTNLIGHWDPDSSSSYGGVGTTYNNLVSAREDLKIYGAAFVSVTGTPKHFAFDGTNDKISDIDTSDPYDDNFQINAGRSWAISMWVKFSSFSTNVLWSLGDGDDESPMVYCTMESSSNGGTTQPSVWCDTSETHPPALSAGNWYMITWRNRFVKSSAACIIDVFYNGVLQDSMHYDTDSGSETDWVNTYTVLAAVGARDLDIGFNEADDSYMNNATSLGAILAYEKNGTNCLPNSAIWSNYLATKDTYRASVGGGGGHK